MTRAVKHPSALASGERVFLRPPTPGEREELASLGAASGRLHRPWLAAPATIAAVDEWMARMETDRFGSFLVCRHDEGAIVGVFNLSEIVRGSFQSCFLSYYAHSAFAGKGYLSEGLELLLRHVFRALKLHRVEATSSLETRHPSPSSAVRDSVSRDTRPAISRSLGVGATTNDGRSLAKTGAAVRAAEGGPPPPASFIRCLLR